MNKVLRKIFLYIEIFRKVVDLVIKKPATNLDFEALISNFKPFLNTQQSFQDQNRDNKDIVYELKVW